MLRRPKARTAPKQGVNITPGFLYLLNAFLSFATGFIPFLHLRHYTAASYTAANHTVIAIGIS
jgi:hypothetical protein